MSGLAQPAHKGPGTDLTEAENRLSEMRTQEVGIVDEAANLRGFLTMKSKDGMATPTSKDATPPAPPAATPPAEGEPAAKEGLTLPTAARDAMVAGLTDALEKLTGLAQAVGEATIDDAAPVPSEVGELFKQCAELLNSLAGDTAAPAAGDGAAAPAAAPVAAAAPAPAAKDAEGEATEKAGKVLSAANRKKVQGAFDALKGLLEATETKTKKDAAGDDAAGDADPITAKVHKMLGQFGAQLEAQSKAMTEAQAEQAAKVAKALGEKNATIAAHEAALAKAKAKIATLSKRANSPGGGNAGTDTGEDPVTKGGGGNTAADGTGRSWGEWEREVNARKRNPGQAEAGR